MKEIIPKVPREEIIAELTEKCFLRSTGKGGNQIYLVNNTSAPRTVREIGRLREISFRMSGGGTGKELDLDNYDVSPDSPYEQLIAWDPDAQEIVAGYRLLFCRKAPRNNEGQLQTATTKLFAFSERFYKHYVDTTLELGRSFVQPLYQSKNHSPKAIYSLDNLWDGLGAVLNLNTDIDHFIGKVTMYPDYNREARNILQSFLHTVFPDEEYLARPIVPLISPFELAPYHHLWANKAYKEAYALLNKMIRDRDENIPPMINSYMNLSPSMKTFGTAANNAFGNVEETGIMLHIGDIYEAKRQRYIDSYPQHITFVPPA